MNQVLGTENCEESSYAPLLAAAQAFSPAGITVALISGGTSEERPISLASGDGALAALQEAGFTVKRFDPASEADMAALTAAAAAKEVQVAFLTLHGKGGEDGTIQAFLEEIGLPYTGSGVAASQLAIDKHASKCAYQKAQLPTAPWVKFDAATVARAQEQGVFTTMCEKALALMETDKTVVKAVEQGSTQGLYIVDTVEDMAARILDALTFDTCAIVEKFITGPEYTVAVVGNDDPVAFPIINIVAASGFYDYDAKYLPGGSKHLCPAPISAELTEEIKAYAVTAHKTLGCKGMSRTDFIVDADGKPWILETNTIPGMTATSLFPDAAKVAGFSFAELSTLLIKLALE